MKTYRFDCARDGSLYGEEFVCEHLEDAQAAAVAAINADWRMSYESYDDMSADMDGCDIIEEEGVMAPRVTVERMAELEAGCAPATVYLVEGRHWGIPGDRVEVAASRAEADSIACRFVEELRADVLEHAQVFQAMGGTIEADIETPAPLRPWEEVLGSLKSALATMRMFGIVEALAWQNVDVTVEPMKVSGKVADDPRPAQVVVNITGGMVQGVISDGPVDVYCIDYDTEGGDGERMIAVPQDGGTTIDAHAYEMVADEDAGWVQSVIDAIGSAEGDSCLSCGCDLDQSTHRGARNGYCAVCSGDFVPDQPQAMTESTITKEAR